MEPYWYQGGLTPYYRKSHIKYRARVRRFVEEEIKPHIDSWLESGKQYPTKLHRTAYLSGITGILFPTEYGGTRPADFDAFHELILWDELARSGGGGALGQVAINSMALPPILLAGSPYLKKLVARRRRGSQEYIPLHIRTRARQRRGWDPDAR